MSSCRNKYPDDESPALSKSTQKRLVAQGAYGRDEWSHLPPLLRNRRVEYNIPDGAFAEQFGFDRVAIWQIAEDEGDTFKGSLIVKAETTKDKEKREAPRGVIVSAGARAMDELRTNGFEIGQVVRFVRLAPWRLPVDMVDGKKADLMVIRSGDIVSSFDLMEEAKANGHCAYVWNADGQEHRYRNMFDTTRSEPAVSEDY